MLNSIAETIREYQARLMMAIAFRMMKSLFKNRGQWGRRNTGHLSSLSVSWHRRSGMSRLDLTVRLTMWRKKLRRLFRASASLTRRKKRGRNSRSAKDTTFQDARCTYIANVAWLPIRAFTSSLFCCNSDSIWCTLMRASSMNRLRSRAVRLVPLACSFGWSHNDGSMLFWMLFSARWPFTVMRIKTGDSPVLRTFLLRKNATRKLFLLLIDNFLS